jgi:hypothetical protein
MTIFLERFLIPLLALILGNGLLFANPMGIDWPIRILGILFVTVLAALIALLSGNYDELRQKQYPRLSKFILTWRRRLMSLLQIWPSIGMVVGGLLFIACVWWQLAENRRANAEIHETLSRYVLPRHLSEQQIKTIGDYLAQYPPQQYKFVLIKNYEEGGAYRVDIQRALTLGGWDVTGYDYLDGDEVREGLCLQYTETQESSQKRPDPKHPKPMEVLQKAFQLAHVAVNGTGGGSGPADTMAISIGHRRMDDEELIGKEQMRERARRFLEGDEPAFR